jgi:hypothetical protein
MRLHVELQGMHLPGTPGIPGKTWGALSGEAAAIYRFSTSFAVFAAR